MPLTIRLHKAVFSVTLTALSRLRNHIQRSLNHVRTLVELGHFAHIIFIASQEAHSTVTETSSALANVAEKRGSLAVSSSRRWPGKNI